MAPAEAISQKIGKSKSIFRPRTRAERKAAASGAVRPRPSSSRSARAALRPKTGRSHCWCRHSEAKNIGLPDSPRTNRPVNAARAPAAIPRGLPLPKTVMRPRESAVISPLLQFTRNPSAAHRCPGSRAGSSLRSTAHPIMEAAGTPVEAPESQASRAKRREPASRKPKSAKSSRESRPPRRCSELQRPRSAAAKSSRNTAAEAVRRIIPGRISRGTRAKSAENAAAPAAIGITLAEIEAVIPSITAAVPQIFEHLPHTA